MPGSLSTRPTGAEDRLRAVTPLLQLYLLHYPVCHPICTPGMCNLLIAPPPVQVVNNKTATGSVQGPTPQSSHTHAHSLRPSSCIGLLFPFNPIATLAFKCIFSGTNFPRFRTHCAHAASEGPGSGSRYSTRTTTIRGKGETSE